MLLTRTDSLGSEHFVTQDKNDRKPSQATWTFDCLVIPDDDDDDDNERKMTVHCSESLLRNRHV